MIDRNILDPSLIAGGMPDQAGRFNPVHLLEAGKLYASRLLVGATREINDHLLVGESHAIMAYAGTLIARDNLLLVSIPGAGKTEMLSHFHRVIDGIEDDNVVAVPARTDMTPAELTGKGQTLVTTRVTGGITVVERTTGEVEPLLRTTNQLVTFDEANRGNERTMSTSLDMTGSRKLTTSNGREDMDDLESVILAINPTESLLTTSRLSAARAARQAWGSVLADEAEWDTILDAIVDNEFEPTPDEMQAVLSLPELHVAQAAVRYVVIESTMDKPYLKIITKQMLRDLRGHELAIQEAPGRVVKQLMSTARTLALMKGRTSVVREDIKDAAELKMIASLAGNGIHDLRDIDPVVNEVIEKSDRTLQQVSGR